MTEHETDARLTRARAALLTALAGEPVQAALVDVAQQLGQLGITVLSDRLDALLGAVRTNRAAQAAAMSEYEQAFTDHVTRLLLTHHIADVTTQRENRRRLEALERWAYGTGQIPPPGVPDEDDYTGRG